MIVENQNLVKHLNNTVLKKTEQKSFNNVRINFVKDDGKKEASDHYGKLLSLQVKEWENQLQASQKAYETRL